MPDFKNIRERLQTNKKLKSDSDRTLFVTKQKLAKIQKEIAAFLRVFDDKNQNHIEILQRLRRSEASLNSRIESLQVAQQRDEAIFLGSLKEFTLFEDPRVFSNQLNDLFPILLFPVRIETRFKKTNERGNLFDELWVRIFPDTCVIDSFEEVLSESEIESAKVYWTKIWQAGGQPEQEKAAWKFLVEGVGSGRSTWIIKNYKPVNILAQPQKGHLQDIILVIIIPQGSSLIDSEIPAIEDYWKAIWLAGDKQLEVLEAQQRLIDNIGAERATEISNRWVPVNIGESPILPFTKDQIGLQVAFIEFPLDEKVDSQESSWSNPPKVNVFPERFVFLAYEDNELVINTLGNSIPYPLTVGPDPLADDDKQIRQEDDELMVGGSLNWLIDFNEAVEKGMGFKIRISEKQAKEGFDRIIVLGLRLSSDEDESKALLEDLFAHHYRSSTELSFVPQGTPTNNTEQNASGYSSREDSDDSFNIQNSSLGFEENWALKKDGQVLADALGIDPNVFNAVPFSFMTDQCESRAMNTALWPGTMGYFLESLMQPIVSEIDVSNTRNFFTNFVSGRGMLPAIRIGEQPYGILPTTAFSRLAWFDERNGSNPGLREALSGNRNYFRALFNLLNTIQSHWNEALSEVAHVYKSGDAHQNLLGALGLHGNSVLFYQRYMESFKALFNKLNRIGFDGQVTFTVNEAQWISMGYEFLEKLGYERGNDEVADMLKKGFHETANLLSGALIDDQPLSETNPIRNYTENDENYISWLISAAKNSHNALRLKEGFKENKRPSALLFLLLHHALDLGFVDASLKLHLSANMLNMLQVRDAKKDPEFIHIQENQAQSTESKWRFLYEPKPEITGNSSIILSDFIPQVLNSSNDVTEFKEQIDALEHLKDIPTARLERLLIEHLDCCNYRLDAWKLGLVNFQLINSRNTPGNQGEQSLTKGVYLGAFGYLEDIRPENKEFTPVRLPPNLSEIFNKPGEEQIQIESTNGGYIQAPSLNHAVTAAILRNGYLSNLTPENPDLLKVNISSHRVRSALAIIEGIRNGQSLAALLGYQFERGLHDRYDLQLDQFLFELRKKFPLYGDQFESTKTDKDIPIEAIEARNVVNGLTVIKFFQEANNNGDNDPFRTILKDASSTQKNAIEREVNRIIDTQDAVADLAISESVHQIVQGNYDRAAATLDTYSKGNFPPIPDVVQTPRSGHNITHRVAIHFESELGHNPASDDTFRAIAEPALSKWLDSLLPPLEDIACIVNSQIITLQDIGIKSIDLLYLINTEGSQSMKAIDDLIVFTYHTSPLFSAKPDIEIKIQYIEKIPGKITFFELTPLLRSLRKVILQSRPLETTDVSLPHEENIEKSANIVLYPERINAVVDQLELLVNNLDLNLIEPIGIILNQIENLDLEIDSEFEEYSNLLNQICQNIDTWINSYMPILKSTCGFGFSQPSLSSVLDKKGQLFGLIWAKIESIVIRWNEKLEEFDQKILDFNNLPPDSSEEEKMQALQNLELIISTSLTFPVPDNIDDYQIQVLDKRVVFENKKLIFEELLNTDLVSISEFLSAFDVELPISGFDLEKVDLEIIKGKFLTLAEDIYREAEALKIQGQKIIDKVRSLLEAIGQTSDNEGRVDLFSKAAKLLFGKDFMILPEFQLSDSQGNEWSNTWASSSSLLNFQKNIMQNPFPVDDWMHGLARVREKMREWENIAILSEAFTEIDLELKPIQLPYKEEDRWLASEFLTKEEMMLKEEKIEFTIDTDKLLYTAFYHEEFNKDKRQCGILIDEWNELIPTKEETMGVTFHYDKPNSEPWNSMLLVCPPSYNGNWQWQDIVDAIIETIAMAKQRAIEPDQIENLGVYAYARFLPAAIFATTGYPIMPGLNLAMNNMFYNAIKP